MIPALSTIIAAYVVLRCIEIMATNPAHFTSQTARVGVALVALLVIGVTFVMWLDIAAARSSDPIRTSSSYRDEVQEPVRENVLPSPEELERARKEVRELMKQTEKLKR